MELQEQHEQQERTTTQSSIPGTTLLRSIRQWSYSRLMPNRSQVSLFDWTKKALMALGVVFVVYLLLSIAATLFRVQQSTVDPIVSESADQSPPLATRRNLVRIMARDAWTAYTRYAMGADALRPLSRTNLTDQNQGESILAAATTLWAMNLTKEYEQARAWIDKRLPEKKMINPSTVNGQLAQRFINEVVGALMSLYALTADQLYLYRATEMFHRLSEWAETASNASTATLDEMRLFEQLQKKIEVRYLVDLLRDEQYPDEQVVETLLRHWGGSPVSWSDMDEHMQKFANQFRSDANRMELTDCANTALISAYINKWDPKVLQPRPGTPKEIWANATRYLAELNESVAGQRNHEVEICYERAHRTATHLPMDDWSFVDVLNTSGIMERENATAGYRLSYSLAEAYFYLYRLTGESRYQNYAWELAGAIERHCRARGGSGGFAGVVNVNRIPVKQIDLQEPHFLSATLKYLYMTFVERNHELLSLEKWLFNARGHPLPICGGNRAYPGRFCKYNDE